MKSALLRCRTPINYEHYEHLGPSMKQLQGIIIDPFFVLGYSLLLTRDPKSYIVQSDNFTAQWISDLFLVQEFSSQRLCLSFHLETATNIQVIHYEETRNGTATKKVVFLTGTNTSEAESAQGRFELLLKNDTYKTQIIVQVSENTTIHDVKIDFNFCQRSGEKI